MSAPSRLTVSRTSPEDIGTREVFVGLDGEELAILRHGESVTREIPPGAHELRAHNTLFRRREAFSVSPGEEARYIVVNRPGWGTMSLMTFLGAGPLYLTLQREPDLRSQPQTS
jgi:hypothetical protein